MFILKSNFPLFTLYEGGEFHYQTLGKTCSSNFEEYKRMYLKGNYGKYRCAYVCISLRKILSIDIEYENI